ncbi:phytase [Streptomyces lichenis]|uniref:Phytase n=1 Tax=Streptomyces lichenis TaxID=2306967 RepID=A0ABT0I931_9ACTN|nr:phytase [Streptomyces lichenis]MCK8677831.1 phytase [Streptomyces lichenis]
MRHRPTRLTALALLGSALAVLATAAPPVTAAGPEHPGQRHDRPVLPAVTPRADTPTLHDDEAGGNADADDPAIWRNPADPDRSLVVATAKEGGLRVYDLDARVVQSVPAPPAPGPEDAPGRFNNVDLVHGLRLGTGGKAGHRSRPADAAVTTDRGRDRLRVYRITAPGRSGAAPLTDVTDPAAPPVFSAGGQGEINEQRTAYGLATWTDEASGRSYALVSRRERTRIALLELLPTARGTVTYRTVRTLDLPASFRLPNGRSWSPCAEPGEQPQVEGMVVDPAHRVLYAGQEDVGIWRVRADLTGAPVLLDKVREFGVPGTYDEETEECAPGADPGFGGRHLAADVEGLTLLPGRGGGGRLLASSQGDDTFAAYDRRTAARTPGYGSGTAYAGGFRVVAGRGPLDGAEECDGAAVLNAPLGRRYPHGLLVVQDGRAGDPQDGGRASTGFKFVALEDVRGALKG